MALTDVKSEQIQSSVALAGSPTTTTQSASDNSTKVATTAYVETAVANLVASAPSALNTLDELAAALNDDASFSTTVTNSIATKLPLAGGTLTGNLRINTTLGIGAAASSVIGVYSTKSFANGLAAELSNTESSTGSGLVVKGGNNALSSLRRETMFINILQGLHPLEAEILILVKDKDLESKYKIPKAVVSQAFPDIQWGGRS